MVLMGLFYSLYASVLYPSIPLICQEHLLGTAYGIISAAQNLGLTLAYLGIGYITDKATSGEGYIYA